MLNRQGGITDEEITFGQAGNSASDNFNAIRLYLGNRR
jgi:hypothetical protein